MIVAEVENVALPAVNVAVTMTLPPPEGGLKGAVYRPVSVIEPQAPAAMLLQLTEKVTGLVGALPLLVTVNCCCAPVLNVRLEGVMVRPAPRRIVAVAVADLVVSATETAVIVTDAGLGTLEGAVYRPAALIMPTVVMSPPTRPFTAQVTADDEPPLTVAVNC